MANKDGVLGPKLRSGVRALVGVAAPLLAAKAAKLGFQIDQAEASAWLYPLAIWAYNEGVRVLEHKYPSLGWLLGAPKA